jgi:hypothetical protein
MLPEEGVTVELPVDMVRSKGLDLLRYRVIDEIG